MLQHDERFTPEEVDEQIEQLSLHLARPHQMKTRNMRIIEDLQHLSQTRDTDPPNFERMWPHLNQQLHDSTDASRGHAQAMPPIPYREESHSSRRSNALFPRKRPALQDRLVMAAAVVLLTLLIGSMVVVLNLAHSNPTGKRSTITVPTGTSSTATGLTPSSSTTPDNGTALPTHTTGTIYGVANTVLYKLDAKSQTVTWAKFFPTNNIATLPVVANDVVYLMYFTSENNPFPVYLYALRAKDGSQLWRITLPALPQPPPELASPNNYTPPTVANGMVYISSSTGNVFAISASNGSLRWASPSLCPDVYVCDVAGAGSVVVENGIVYGTVSTQIYALNAATGAKRWIASIDATQTGIPTMPMSQTIESGVSASNNVVFTTGLDNSGDAYSFGYAFDAMTGKRLWKTGSLPDKILNTTAINGVVYFGGIGHGLYAYRLSDGRPLWRTSLPSSNVDALSSVINGEIYIDARDRFLAVNIADGAIRWERAIDGGDASHELLGVTGSAIFVEVERQPYTVFAYSIVDGQELWQMQLHF